MQKVKLTNGIIEDLVVIEDIQKELQNERELKLIKYSISDEFINSIKSKPEVMVTFSEQESLKLREKIDKEYEEKLSMYDEYKELVCIPYTESYNEEVETLIPKFKDVGDKVECTFIIELDKNKIRKLISKIKQFLVDTDYIVIKSYEAKLSMLDAPYKQEYLDEVLNKRQVARDKINELESLLKQ